MHSYLFAPPYSILGKPAQAANAGEALRDLLSTLVKRELKFDDPVHVRWFTLDGLRRPAFDRIETETHSAIQIQQMPAARVRERFLCCNAVLLLFASPSSKALIH